MRSACNCFTVRRCLRDLPASVLSQPASFSAKGSSLLCRSGVANCGSTVPAFRCFLMVLRDRPVRRAISRIASPCRKRSVRMTFNSPMWITPSPPSLTAREKGHMGQISMKIIRLPGSVLGENQQVCFHHSRYSFIVHVYPPSRSSLTQPCAISIPRPNPRTRCGMCLTRWLRRRRSSKIWSATCRRWPGSCPTMLQLDHPARCERRLATEQGPLGHADATGLSEGQAHRSRRGQHPQCRLSPGGAGWASKLLPAPSPAFLRSTAAPARPQPSGLVRAWRGSPPWPTSQASVLEWTSVRSQ